jgi:hypothetical protein
MRSWAKATIGLVGIVVLAFAALAATGAYFVFRHMDRHASAESDAVQAFDAVKARFGPRPPLVEIVDPARGDIRINRPVESSPVRVDTFHIVNWKRDGSQLMRTDVPVWLLRFSTLNIASQLGIAPARFRLTVDDIQRYGPGIVVDYGSPGSFRVLLWVD